jgi:two-component system chemotaxis response regulator CheB
MRALGQILDALPADLDVALLVAQHRGPSPSSLASLLAPHTAWAVTEAEDKQPIRARHVYLAPPGYHLLVEGDHMTLSTEGPVAFSRPSVDVLFESAAEACGDRVVAVVLTGANADGAAGLRQVVRRGGQAVIQDPASAERTEMPMAALAAVPDAAIVPILELGQHLAELCRQPASAPGGSS